MRYLLVRTGWGIPQPGQDGVPLQPGQDGVPPDRTAVGVPATRRTVRLLRSCSVITVFPKISPILFTYSYDTSIATMLWSNISARGTILTIVAEVQPRTHGWPDVNYVYAHFFFRCMIWVFLKTDVLFQPGHGYGAFLLPLILVWFWLTVNLMKALFYYYHGDLSI